MFQAFLSGLRGQRERSPSPEVIEATRGAPRDGEGTALPRASTNGAAASGVPMHWPGVQQLQELQAQALQKGDASPEAIRQTIPPFPVLKGNFWRPIGASAARLAGSGGVQCGRCV